MATRVSFGRSWKVRLGVFAVALFLAVGVFAANDWFPKTDPMTGAKTGWFGRKMPKNTTASNWNPFPPPPPTPSLSKEYLYAGSRLLAVEDAEAITAPPADIAIWRPTGGEWWVMEQAGTNFAWSDWGIAGDVPVPGDYDADGKTDFAIWRPSDGYWWIYFSSTSSYTAIQLGQSGDIPVQADYDGDGKTDIGVARRNVGDDQLDWYITYSGGGSFNGEFGLDDDTPGPADFDGDGKADRGVYRGSNDEYYWQRSSDDELAVIDLNNDGHKVVSSDYDGDGKADPAVFNTTTSYWYVYQSTTNSVVSSLWSNNGAAACTGSCPGDLTPVHNDYDLDGKTDIAVWTAGWWYIKRSSNGTTRTEQWGTTGDIPVPAFYRR